MTRDHIPDLQLELLALDALPLGEARDLRAALDRDPEAKARFDALADSDDALLREFPPEDVNAEVARRLALLEAESAGGHPVRPVPLSRRPLFWVPLAAASVAILLFFVPTADHTPGFRVKGEPHLVIHRVSGDSAEQLAQGDVARTGDRIQLSIAPAGRIYALVFSIDGNGALTLHFPGKEGDGQIGTSAPFSLPTSYRLDDAPAFERFFLITSYAPLDTEAILKTARELAARADRRETGSLEDLPGGVRQSSFLLRKAR